MRRPALLVTGVVAVALLAGCASDDPAPSPDSPSAASPTTDGPSDASGAWATYDTAPMSLRESGESGGCPTLE